MLSLEVTVISSEKVIFEGKARSVIMPGEYGVFEVQPLHKDMLTRLISGTLSIDDRGLRIKRGVARVSNNRVVVIIE